MKLKELLAQVTEEDLKNTTPAKRELILLLKELLEVEK